MCFNRRINLFSLHEFINSSPINGLVENTTLSILRVQLSRSVAHTDDDVATSLTFVQVESLQRSDRSQSVLTSLLVFLEVVVVVESYVILIVCYVLKSFLAQRVVNSLIVVSHCLIIVTFLSCHGSATSCGLLSRMQFMSCLTCCEIDIALGTMNTFVELSEFLQYIEVLQVALYYRSIDLIHLSAISGTGGSEQLIYVVTFLSSIGCILVVLVISLSGQIGRSQLVIGDKLLSVLLRILFVELTGNLSQGLQNLHLAFRTHSLYRFTETLTCLSDTGISKEADVCQTLLTHDILFRVLGIISEETHTFVLHLQCEISQTLFLCGISSFVIEAVDHLRTLAVKHFVGIRALRIHFVPVLIRCLVHLCPHIVGEQVQFHQTLVRDCGLLFFYCSGYLNRRLFCYFFRFLCTSQHR